MPRVQWLITPKSGRPKISVTKGNEMSKKSTGRVVHSENTIATLNFYRLHDLLLSLLKDDLD